MGTVIRSLMVKVGADLTDMQKGLKQASKELKSVGKSLTTTGTALTKGITLPAIAAATGFENDGYFYRFFAKKAGVTPGAFRRSHRMPMA